MFRSVLKVTHNKPIPLIVLYIQSQTFLILRHMETLIAKITDTIKNQLPSDKFYVQVKP